MEAPGSERPVESNTINLCLERVLASAQFARSERLRALLAYLIQAMERGTLSSVNERRIGVDVFGKDVDWDPALDPSVRVAMVRLRSKLEDYYQSAGRTDAIKIALIKGSYLPQLIQITHPTAMVDTVAANDTHNSAASSVSVISFSRNNLYRIFTLSICLLIVIVLVGFPLGRHWFSKKAASFYITPFSTDLGIQFSPAVSPDCSRIAYVWDENHGSFNLYIRPVDGGSTVKLTGGTGNDFYPAWSPDGTQLAFLRVSGWQAKLIVKLISSGTEKTVATIAVAPGRWSDDSGPLLGNPGPIWSIDGNELIVFDQGHFGIYAISIKTGERRQLTSSTQTTRDFYPRLSLDGKSLAFVRYLSHGVSDLYMLSMGSNASPKRLTHDQRTIRGITWAADGKSLVMASNRTGQYELWRVDTQNAILETIPADTSQAANPAMAPNGKWMVFDNAHEITTIEEAFIPAIKNRPFRLYPIAVTSRSNRDASLSNDGKRLAFFSDRSGSWQIWISAADGSEARQITHLNVVFAGMISWAPDGRHIAYDARLENHSSIFLLDTITGQSRMLSTTNAEERAPTWSPDGKIIYFNSDRDGSVALYRLHTDSGRTSLVANDGFQAHITQNGQWLYYVTMYGVLWRSRPDTNDAFPMPQDMQPYSFAAWTVTGNDLLILKRSEAKDAFELWKFDASFHSISLGEFSVAPQSEVLSIGSSIDGHILLVGTRDQITSDIVLRSPINAPPH